MAYEGVCLAIPYSMKEYRMTTRRNVALAATMLLWLAGCGEAEIKEGDNFSLFLTAEGEAMRMEYNVAMGECSERMEQENSQEPRNDWDQTRKWHCERQEDGYAI